MQNQRFLSGATAVAWWLLAASASAQTPSIIPAGGVPGCDFAGGQITSDCIINFLTYIIKFIFGLTGALCLLMIMIAGYQYAIGSLFGGDSGGANERLKWAIGGFIICALSFYIIDFVISSFSGG